MLCLYIVIPLATDGLDRLGRIDGSIRYAEKLVNSYKVIKEVSFGLLGL